MRLALPCLLALIAASTASAGTLSQDGVTVEWADSVPGQSAELDSAVKSWMKSNDIHAAQLAVRKSGRLIFSHAYTIGAKYPTVTTTNVFRLASVSKMLLTAAFSKMLTQGKLTGGERVYNYLGITKPLLASQTPDRRSRDIVALELAEHTAGLPGEGTGDPLFEMRDIEVALGAEPLTALQFAQYLYGIKLLSQPGFTSLYSNVGYFLLGQVIAKAAGKSYDSYVQSELLKPLGMTNWTLSPTSQADANPNEVFADDLFTRDPRYSISPAPRRKSRSITKAAISSGKWPRRRRITSPMPKASACSFTPGTFTGSAAAPLTTRATAAFRAPAHGRNPKRATSISRCCSTSSPAWHSPPR